MNAATSAPWTRRTGQRCRGRSARPRRRRCEGQSAFRLHSHCLSFSKTAPLPCGPRSGAAGPESLALVLHLGRPGRSSRRRRWRDTGCSGVRAAARCPPPAPPPPPPHPPPPRSSRPLRPPASSSQPKTPPRLRSPSPPEPRHDSASASSPPTVHELPLPPLPPGTPPPRAPTRTAHLPGPADAVYSLRC